MREKIKKLLGRNLSTSVVASAVGCTDAYVSQLLAEPEFSEEVAALKLAMVELQTGRDLALNSIEDKLVEKLELALPMLMRPNDILRAFSIVNNAKRHGDASINNSSPNQQIVNVNLPNITVQTFLRNSQQEIVEVGGRSLATLTPAALKNMLVSKQLGALNDQTTQAHERAVSFPKTLQAETVAAGSAQSTANTGS